MGLNKKSYIFFSLLSFNCFTIYSHVSAAATDHNVQVQLKCPVSPTTCTGVTGQTDRVVVTLSSGLKVMCDTKTDGGGWIIFQRRIIGNVDFYRGWEEYLYGFGDYVNGEFYLGNEIVHQMTSKRRFELRIDLKFNNSNYFASYSRFRLYGEAENYRLKISGYYGNATDNLITVHGDKMFSTFDKDNDPSNGNCAILYHGAWWYNGCLTSNLNGKWASRNNSIGLIWFGLTGQSSGVTMSEMKIREM